jgi:hypothetical protein
MLRFHVRSLAAAGAAGILLSTVSVAHAQGRPRPAIDVSAAWVGFADDGIVSETAMGAAFRWYVSPRVAIGPELIHIRGDNHTHLALTGNLTWDLLPATGGGRITPFLVAGAGMFQTHETFFDDSVTSREGAFTAGGGVRARVGDRVSVGVDARLGWEPHVRLGGFAAISLGRR